MEDLAMDLIGRNDGSPIPKLGLREPLYATSTFADVDVADPVPLDAAGREAWRARGRGERGPESGHVTPT